MALRCGADEQNDKKNHPKSQNLENPDTKFFIIQNQKISKPQNFENTSKTNYCAQLDPPATTPKVFEVISEADPVLPGVFVRRRQAASDAK